MILKMLEWVWLGTFFLLGGFIEEIGETIIYSICGYIKKKKKRKPCYFCKEFVNNGYKFKFADTDNEFVENIKYCPICGNKQKIPTQNSKAK